MGLKFMRRAMDKQKKAALHDADADADADADGAAHETEDGDAQAGAGAGADAAKAQPKKKAKTAAECMWPSLARATARQRRRSAQNSTEDRGERM
jgi:hypothetical protein